MRQVYSYIKIGVVFCFFIITSCGGGGGGDAPEEVINDPEVATLIFPEANSECTEGTNENDTESTIVFKWNTAQFATSYNLKVKDLESSNVSTHLSNEPKFSVRLKRNHPYSWSVISKSNTSSETATSAVWKFYNAGSGVVSYAPFPAEAVSPSMGTSIDGEAISLDWSGSDVDGDIDSYDVYLGETNSPGKIETAIQESILNTVSVVSGKTYYWKIVTKDKNGNSSSSDVFKFHVN